MNRLAAVTFAAFILSMAACSEELVSPDQEGLPDKLSPYETFFDAEAFELRRDDLVSRLPANSLVVLVTSDLIMRNGDVAHEFRPASTFYYLTGFDEPYSAAVIRQGSSRNDSELILLVQERSETVRRWLGPTHGVEAAIEVFGADEAYEITALGDVLSGVLESEPPEHVYANLRDNPAMAATVESAAAGFSDVLDVRPVVDMQRMVKTPIEIEAIRRAVDVSVQGFSEAMEFIEPGVFEYEIDALFDYVLRVNGSPRAAFPTIVASGPNSTVLHYDANTRQMAEGELVMIDFGAEYAFYAADVTRTLPVGGTFSDEQAALYNIVLEAHYAVLDMVGPGVSYGVLYERSRDIVLDGLLSKGIITGDRQDIISSGRYRQYIPAGLAHCVGLDVHDPFPANEAGMKMLQEGMVLAFEPHVYLEPSDLTVAAAYRGLSVRIEDDVLVTSSGAEVLSAALPAAIPDIEARMR